MILDIAETPQNLAEYEKITQGSSTRRPFPQVKIVALGEAGSHAVLDARIGSMRQGERELAAPLTRTITQDMLILADRGFYSYDLWRTYLLTGAALIWRLSRTTHLPVLTELPDGSYLSEITSVRGPGKTRIPLGAIADPMLATHIPVRVIEYQISAQGPDLGEPFRLITTILDHHDVDAHIIAATYNQRWEIESSFREIECQLLEPGTTLRSKNPETVRQEIWGLLLTHYAIRAFITEAADTTELDPDRISTLRAINIIRRAVTDATDLSPLTPNHTPHTKTPSLNSSNTSTPSEDTAPTPASTKEAPDTPSPPKTPPTPNNHTTPPS